MIKDTSYLNSHISIWIICLGLFGMIASTTNTYSQVSDTAIMRVHYTSLSKNYSDSKASKEDWSCLDIGNHSSKFYSMNTWLIDSTKNVLIDAGLSPEAVFLKVRAMNRGNEDVIIKDYSSPKLGFLSKIIVQEYFYEEPMEMDSWDLINDTLTILDYKCYKAQKEFRGRTWTVWYSTDIPSMDGPWKLAGLPGLILKAQDSTADFSFECNGIELLSKVAIIEPLSNLGNGRVIKTDGKTFLQIKKKSVEDLKGTIVASGFTISSVKDENGVEVDIPKRKMNSIEEYK